MLSSKCAFEKHGAQLIGMLEAYLFVATRAREIYSGMLTEDVRFLDSECVESFEDYICDIEGGSVC